MKRFAQKLALFSAVATAALGTAVLPATQAQARPVPLCPLVVGVCTWTAPAFEGDLRILFNEEPFIQPAARSASNQDVQPWCFYEQPFFGKQGQMREVSAGEAVHDFGFDAHSAMQGLCQYDG